MQSILNIYIYKYILILRMYEYNIIIFNEERKKNYTQHI